MGVVLFLLCVDMLLEGFGLPEFLRRDICSIAGHYGAELWVGQLCMGVFRGVVARGVTLHYETEAGLVSVAADDIVLDISPIGLLSRDVPIEKVTAKNLSVELMGQSGEPLYELDTDELLFLTPQFTKGRIQCNSTLNGIRFDCSLEILRLDRLAQMVEELASTPSYRKRGRNGEVCRTLESIAASMRQMDFIREDTSITVDAVFDCANPKDATLQGSFSLSDAILRDVVFSRLRGRIYFNGGQAGVHDLMLLTSTGDILRANADVDIRGRRLSCDLDGGITPMTLLKMLGGDAAVDTSSSIVSMQRPFRYRAVLKDYDFGSFSGDARMSWEVSGLELWGMPIDKFECQLDYHDGVVGLHDLSIQQGHGMALSGSLNYYTQDKGISFDVEGSLNLASLARTAHLELPEEFRPSLLSRFRFDLSLPRSPLAPELWDLKSSFALERQRLAYWEIDDLKGNLQLEKGVLRLQGVTCQLDYFRSGRPLLSVGSSAFPVFSEFVESHSDVESMQEEAIPQVGKRLFLDLDLDLNGILAGGKEGRQLEIKHHLALSAPKGDADVRALDWEGKLTFDLRRKTLAAEGRGKAFIDLVYQALLAESKISGVEDFDPFHSGAIPQELTMQIPPFRLQSPQECRMEMQIDCRDCCYGSFEVKQGSTLLKLDAQRLSFTDIQAVTQEGYETSMDIEIQFAPFFLKIKDLMLKGDPMAAASFITSSEANAVYSDIWSECTWDSAALPVIHIPLIYYTSDALDAIWEFKLDGSIRAERAFYRDQEISNLECGIALTLPGALDLKPIKVKVGESELEGECNIRFDGAMPYTFKVSGKKGIIRPGQVLAMINPSFREPLETLTFQDNTQFTCSGSFFLEGAPSLMVTGDIQSPECSFHGLTFNDVDANWSYENNQAFWHTKKATFMNGDFKTTGVHNILTHSSDLVCTGQNMSWETLLKAIFKSREKEYDDTPGIFNFTCNLQVKHGWAGQPYHLGGDGYFSLTRADLWEMPLMRQLSRMVQMTTFNLFSSKQSDTKKNSTFGSITAIRGNAEFHGPRVVVTDFNTNGTIIALSGNGEYNVSDKNLLFKVKASPLKEVSILSTLLKPLSWWFNAELNGTPSDAKWKIKTPLSRLFSTDD